eukprot:1767812-Rhodomonas_salina.1
MTDKLKEFAQRVPTQEDLGSRVWDLGSRGLGVVPGVTEKLKEFARRVPTQEGLGSRVWGLGSRV